MMLSEKLVLRLGPIRSSQCSGLSPLQIFDGIFELLGRYERQKPVTQCKVISYRSSHVIQCKSVSLSLLVLADCCLKLAMIRKYSHRSCPWRMKCTLGLELHG